MQIKINSKFGIPEIFFGMMLAVCIFVFGVIFESSQTPPAGKQAEHGANNGGTQIIAENDSIKITDWLLVGLNFFLVCSTLMLWKANNRSAGIAERALTELERPFVGMRIRNTGFTVNDANTDEPSVLMATGPHFEFDFFNYGRTPATVTEMFVKFAVCKPGEMPNRVNPNEPAEKVQFGVIIGANDSSNRSHRSQSAGIDPNEWLTFSVRDSDLYFFGYVRFRDIFGKRHITLFCLKFSKRDNWFYFDGGESYNFTREEKP